MTARTRRLRVVAACLLSGLIAGLLSASQCSRAGSGCAIAAVQAVSSDPVPWTIWLHWVNWLPGLVFGVLFASATLEWTMFPAQRVLLFGLASALIYVAAGLIFAAFIDVASADEFALIVWVWPAGFVAGGVGAALLRLASNQLVIRVDRSGWSLRRDWVSAFVGSLAGLLFVYIAVMGEQRVLLAWPIAFIVWQVAVGLTLQPRMATSQKALG